MKRIIKLTESDLTRIVKRVMNEAVTGEAAITGTQVREMMKGQVGNITATAKNDEGKTTNIKIGGVLPEGESEGIVLKVMDMYEFKKGEQINLTIPGCKVTPTYGATCKGNFYYKVTCTYGGRKGPDNQLLRIFIPNNRITGCNQ